MTTSQPPELSLPTITTDDLLKMIGDRDVTISRQATLINSQSIRIAELDEAIRIAELQLEDESEESSVTTTAFNTGTTG